MTALTASSSHASRCGCGRRGFLVGLVAAAGAGLVACGDRAGGSGDGRPAPAEIAAGTSCELDGMLLADYAGPKAQIHYADAAGRAAPVFLCDTVELYSLLLKPEQVRKVAAVYVQDMARADWQQPRGHWIDATTAFYVKGSRKHGSMGPTLASFAQEADARAFATQHGGQVLRHGEITTAMVDLSGGANFDARM